MSLRKKIYSLIPTNSNIEHIPEVEKLSNLAVVIHTWDGYSFLWEGWYYYFKQHWNFDLPIKIYFLNEEVEVDFEGVTNIKSGKGEWSDRLKIGLQAIEEENILYMQEDFWLNQMPDIKQYYSSFKQLNMDVLKLHPVDMFITAFRAFRVGNYRYRKIARRSGYLISHQASIWKKEFLIQNLKDNEDPWTNELEGTKRLRLNNNALKIFMVDLDWYNAVCRQGKFTKKGEKLNSLARKK